MKNPSVKKGHLDIANELVDVLARTHLTGNEHKIIYAVWRKTWCWKAGNRKKDFDWISLTQLEKMTNITRMGVCRAKKSLVSKMILLEKDGKIGFNQDYSQWVVSKTILVSKTTTGSIKKVLGGSINNDTHKRYITKDNNTKEMSVYSLIDKKPRSPREFANARRAELGEPPLKIEMTEKQREWFVRAKLVDYFKDKINIRHSKDYFSHPDDIADIKKENSKITKNIKAFFSRCDKNSEKAKEVIDWFSGEDGEWCGWKPQGCFRKDTVVDFENRKKPKKQTYYND